jgi:hypothetical protein
MLEGHKTVFKDESTLGGDVLGVRRLRPQLLVPSACAAALVAAFLSAPAASAAGPPLLLTGRVSTAMGHLDASKKLDVASLTNVSPPKSSVVQLGRLVESKDAKGIARSLVIAGSAKPDRAGRYELHVQPDIDTLVFAASNSGWVNYLLIVVADGVIQVDGVSRHWNGMTWDSAQRDEFAPTKLVPTYVAREGATGKPVQGSTIDMKAITLDGTPWPPTCSASDPFKFFNWTKIIEFHNASISNGSWEYGTTADSDISLGLKPTAGSWSLGATWHVGNSQSATIGEENQASIDTFVITSFEYEIVTLSGPPRLCFLNTWSLVYAKAWSGGAAHQNGTAGFGCLSQPQTQFSTTFIQGTHFKRADSRAEKIQAAMSISGISLEATSGYSTNVTLSWTAARDFMLLCGNNDFPTRSGIIYVS